MDRFGVSYLHDVAYLNKAEFDDGSPNILPIGTQWSCQKLQLFDPRKASVIWNLTYRSSNQAAVLLFCYMLCITFLQVLNIRVSWFFSFP